MIDRKGTATSSLDTLDSIPKSALFLNSFRQLGRCVTVSSFVRCGAGSAPIGSSAVAPLYHIPADIANPSLHLSWLPGGSPVSHHQSIRDGTEQRPVMVSFFQG